MAKPTGTIRPLFFPLNRSEDVASETPNDPPIEYIIPEFPEDSDERIPVILDLSLNEYVALATAIDAGRDLAYGDNSIYIWWIWVRSYFSTMDLCALILQCIQDTPEIQQAIAAYSLSNAIDADTPQNTEIAETNIVPVSVGCESDNLFGMTRQFANFLNVVSEDVLEIFGQAFDALARLGDLIEAVPGLSLLPADDILQMVDAYANQIGDAYTAAYDTQINEDIACALFCIAKENCELTFEQARDWFQSQIAEVSRINFVALVNDIIANNWIGEQSIYVMHMWILDALIFGTEILGIDSARALTTIATMYNDPDSDWSILCSDCAGWVYDFDWLDSQDSWAVQVVNGANGATWANGVGWSSVDINSGSGKYRRISAIQRAISATEITSILLRYELEKGVIVDPNANGLSIVVKVGTTDTRNDTQFSALSDTANGAKLFSVNLANVIQIRLSLSSSYTEDNTFSGSNKLKSVRISGEGVNPFV